LALAHGKPRAKQNSQGKQGKGGLKKRQAARGVKDAGKKIANNKIVTYLEDQTQIPNLAGKREGIQNWGLRKESQKRRGSRTQLTTEEGV